ASCLCLCVCLLLVRPPRAVGTLHSPPPPPLSRLQSLSSQLDLLALGCDVLGARPRDDLSYPARSGQHQRRATTPEPEVPLRRGRLPPHPWLLGQSPATSSFIPLVLTAKRYDWIFSISSTINTAIISHPNNRYHKHRTRPYL
ncbi:hypothetical protein LZ32DRAFT_644635, partial [Colletotrichum eremochloae]